VTPDTPRADAVAALRYVCHIDAMFGVVRPCRHRLRGPLYGEWMAHLCGLCLTLRDLYGQAARLVTNYDGLLVSVLTEAQEPATAMHRTAGPCPLRGFRRADVVGSCAPGAQLAASVSLILAAGKIRDHVADADGAYARRLIASGAGRAAARWQDAGHRAGAAIGFDTSVLTAAISRQAELERTEGLALADVTEPTETAVGAAFAHTAMLAGQPANAAPLAQAGRGFGRIAHLLDAVEDLAADQQAGAYNPLLATRTTVGQARERCADAAEGIRHAVGRLDLEHAALTQSLLVGEVEVAVGRAFRQLTPAGSAWPPGGPPADQPLPGMPGGQEDPFWAAAGQPTGSGPLPQRPPPNRPRRGGSCFDGCGDCDCGDCDCGGCDCGGC
jgi:hypothetical protein